MNKPKNNETDKLNVKNLSFILSEEEIKISKRKYESLVEELAYLRGTSKAITKESITISLTEYENLITIKGMYQELKGMVLPNTMKGRKINNEKI